MKPSEPGLFLLAIMGALALLMVPSITREAQYQAHQLMRPWHTLVAPEHAPLTAEQAAYLESMEVINQEEASWKQ